MAVHEEAEQIGQIKASITPKAKPIVTSFCHPDHTSSVTHRLPNSATRLGTKQANTNLQGIPYSNHDLHFRR